MSEEEEWQLARDKDAFVRKVLEVRDALQPIVDGEIERKQCLAGQAEAYGGVRGKRKVKLADAREICRHAIARLNRAVNEYERD